MQYFLCDDIDDEYYLFNELTIENILEDINEKKLISIIKYAYNNNLLINDTIFNIYQLKDKLPVNIINTFNDCASKLREINLDKYDNINSPCVKVFYIEDIFKYYNKHLDIPDNHLNNLIRYIIDGDITNKNRIKIIYKLKIKHILNDMNIDDCLIISNNNSKNVLGDFRNINDIKYISINFNKLDGTYNKKYSIINTIYHEIRHVLQFRQLYNHDSKNIYEYNMLKEDIINKNKYLYPKFYELNYYNFIKEVDARIFALQNEYNYLNKLGYNLNNYSSNNMKLFFEEYDNNLKYEESILNYSLNGYVNIKSNDKLHIENINNNLIKISNINNLISYLIKNNSNLLNEYPDLLYEFNIDGSIKKRIEIIKEYINENNIIKKNLLKDIIKYKYAYIDDYIDEIVLLNSSNINKEDYDYIINDIINGYNNYYNNINYKDKLDYINSYLNSINNIKLIKK